MISWRGPMIVVDNPSRSAFMARTAQPIPSFGLAMSIGFTKSLAMKLVLHRVISTNLSDEELLVAPLLQPLLA